MQIDQKEFLIQNLTEEGRNYPYFIEKYQIPREQLSSWWKHGIEIREDIKRANDLYNRNKTKESFKVFAQLGKRKFYEWFISQERKCFYCGIEEEKLRALFCFEQGILKTKRGRGRKLELERRDTIANLYSPQNCVLACYICNNHKSDLISEEEHIKHFVPSIKEYYKAKMCELPV